MDKCTDAPYLNKESKVRLKAFDILKLYAIFLVIWGHSIQYFLSSNCYDEPIFRIIYSFHMPLFMMISGYFSTSSMSLPPLLFIKKKFRQLLLPVLSWVIVMRMVRLFIHTQFFTEDNTLLYIKEAFCRIISGCCGPSPFWFIKTCFFCYLLAYLGSNLKNKNIWMFLTFTLSQCITFIPNLAILYPCFLIGIILKDYQKFYYYICHNYLWCLGVFLLMLCFWDKFFWGFDGSLKTIVINYFHTNNSFFLAIISRLYQITIGIVGSLSLIGLFCSLVPQEKTNKLILLCCNWGKYTLGIYILQSLILETFLARYILLDNLNFYVFNFIIAPMLSAFILTLCVYIIKLISKSPRFAFFFLGNSKKPSIIK